MRFLLTVFFLRSLVAIIHPQAIVFYVTPAS
jgi:hypothetical protein